MGLLGQHLLLAGLMDEAIFVILHLWSIGLPLFACGRLEQVQTGFQMTWKPSISGINRHLWKALGGSAQNKDIWQKLELLPKCSHCYLVIPLCPLQNVTVPLVDAVHNTHTNKQKTVFCLGDKHVKFITNIELNSHYKEKDKPYEIHWLIDVCVMCGMYICICMYVHM